MLAHVAPLKCPITKAPTLQASSWTGRPMSSRSTWGSAMEEDEIPYHLLMRWRHVRILKVVMETCEYSKNTYSTKLYRLYRSLQIYIGVSYAFNRFQQHVGRDPSTWPTHRLRPGTVKVTVSPGGTYGGTPSSPCGNRWKSRQIRCLGSECA